MAADEGSSRKGAEKAGAAARGAGRRARSPVTIDVEAKRVPPASRGPAASRSETPAEPPPPPDEAPKPAEPAAARSMPAEGPGKTRPAPVALAVAGGLGGLVVLLLGFGLQATGLLPAPGGGAVSEVNERAEAIAAAAATLDQRVTAIEAASAQTIADRALLDDLARRVGVVDAFGTSLSDRLLNVEASLAALGDDADGGDDDAATREALEALSERMRRLESAPPAPGGEAPAVPDDIGGRIDALEAELAALDSLRGRIETVQVEVTALGARLDGLASAPAQAGESERAARAIAVDALRQAAAEGGAFGADLAMIGALGAGEAELAALAPLAEKGTPSRAELIERFAAVADRILAASRAPSEDSGLVGRVLAYGSDLVRIRPTGPIAGNEPAAVVSRMKEAVAAGDLAAALAEREALDAAGLAASQDWAGAARDREEIDRLVEELARALGAAGEGDRAPR